MKRYLILLAGLLAVTSYTTASEKNKKAEWDVANPPGEYDDVEFSTSEGTWMNLDLSPDGKQIVFDLLGDIYIIPVSGGSAKLLRGGLPFEVQPRFSPDGQHISFTSDAGGGDNIWTMKADGSDAKQITKEDFRLLNNAVWTPDGQYLIARKHFTSTRSLGAGELWMYHISGGSGIQLTEKKNEQQDLGEPCVSADGRYVYYSEDMYPGGYFKYNKDPNKQIYVIKRYDLTTGETETVNGGMGGAVRPEVSNNGKYLAFVKRVHTQSVLYIQDLKTGEEWPVYAELSKDQQEAWAIFGVYTNFSWTPDDKHIIIWAKGKIRKIAVDGATPTEIPFTVKAKHKIAKALKFDQEVAPEQFTVKAIRQATSSPDKQWLVFNAVGYLWKKKLPNGKPARLTDGTDFEFEPSFSPDGKYLAYVTWNDQETGAIQTLSMTDPKAKPVRVTTEKGIYRTPAWSPDGGKLVFQKEGGNNHQGYAYCVKPGLYWSPAKGGSMTFITKEGSYPSFNKSGDRVYFQTGGYLFGGLEKGYHSIKPDGEDKQTHFTSKYTNRFVPSPDNQWVAFNELHKVYIAPFPAAGKSIDLHAKTKAVPVSCVVRDAGISLHWSGDSKSLHWTLGDRYFGTTLSDRFLFLEGAPDSAPPLDTVGLKIGLELPTDKPEGVVALTGARIITMKGDEVIEKGTIIVEGNRIKAIGPAETIEVPASANTIAVDGKTIMPGLVDVHAHMGTFRYGLSPQQQWSYFANLAYGVTTTHDPSSNTEMVFSQSEMVKAGFMTGPRIYSTGIILYGADGDFKAVVNNLADARSAIRRTKAFGAISVKSYNQPRRNQRQQVIEAARKEKILVYPEGGSFFYHNLSMILDGHTGIEHNIPVAPAYNDVIQLWAASKTGYTPTLVVTYGAVNGEYYWYQNTNVWEKERLLKFTPRSVIDPRSRHRTIIPQEEYDNGYVLASQTCKKLTDAGVKVNLGAHGQLQGLGAHWELWMLKQGGMTNMEALRAATLNGADYIGMDKDLGSLEAGKLADLIVLDKNPLEDIFHTESVRYTMVNGRIYDAESMNEIGNYDKKRAPFYWELQKYPESFNWHEMMDGRQKSGCGCHAGN